MYSHEAYSAMVLNETVVREIDGLEGKLIQQSGSYFLFEVTENHGSKDWTWEDWIEHTDLHFPE